MYAHEECPEDMHRRSPYARRISQHIKQMTQALSWCRITGTAQSVHGAYRSWHYCVGLLSNDPEIDACGRHDQGQMSNSGSTTGPLPECSLDTPKVHTLPGLYVVHDNVYPHGFSHPTW